MAFKDLQIQILEDVVETCHQVADLPPDSFFSFFPGDFGRWMKKRRPEEMLDQLQSITKRHPKGPWLLADIAKGLGWPADITTSKSIGSAMKLLGWKSVQRTRKHVTFYVK